MLELEQADGRLAVVYTEKDEIVQSLQMLFSWLLAEDLMFLVPLSGTASASCRRARAVSPLMSTTSRRVRSIRASVTQRHRAAHTATAEGRNAVAHMSGQEPPPAWRPFQPASTRCLRRVRRHFRGRGHEQGIITKKYARINGKTVLEDLGRGTIERLPTQYSHILLGAQPCAAALLTS